MMKREGADREERAAIAASKRGRPVPASRAYLRFAEERMGQQRLALVWTSDSFAAGQPSPPPAPPTDEPPARESGAGDERLAEDEKAEG